MASYLKFDGKRDGLSNPIIPGTASASVRLVCFARLLSLSPRNVPLVQVHNGIGKSIVGIWQIGPTVTPTTRGRLFGFKADPGTLSNVAVDLAGNPLRLGRIYKLEVVVLSSGAFSAGVDGVRLATGGGGFGVFPDVYLFDVGAENASYGGTVPFRAAHMELFQVKLEIDGTVSSSGGFPNVEADSDPFVPMTFDGTATEGGLWLLNDGSGASPVDSSGFGHSSWITPNTAPSWAGAADPSLPSPGVALWDFASVEGYALRQSSAPTITHRPVRGPSGPVGDKTAGTLGLARKAPIWFEDGEQTTQFPISTQLTADLTTPFASRRALKSDGAVATTNSSDIPVPASILPFSWCFVGRFNDPGGTSATRVQRLGVCSNLNVLRVNLGFQGAQSTTNYIAFISGGGGGDFLVIGAVSAGWHEIAIFGSDPGGGANGTLRLYFDGQLVRSEAGIVITGYFARVAIRQNGVSGSNDHAFYDEIDVGVSNATLDAEYAALVESAGTCVLPLLQPAEGVAFFRSVTITETTAGTDSETIGTTSYTFRHSTDGGGTWSAPAALTTANLRVRACAANGQDVLEVTVAQTAGMDNMSSPRTSQIQVDFEPATALLFPDEEFRRDEELLIEEAA